jgi:glycosyltransferase involved in cell wall biosynthesis
MATRVTVAHGVGGGMERHAHLLAHGLAARGHAVTVVTTAGGDAVRGDAGVETVAVPGTTWRRYQRRWWSESYAELRARHAAAPFDAVVSESAGALGYLAAARGELKLRSLVVFHGSARGELATAWRGVRTPRGVYRLLRLCWRLPRLRARWRAAAPHVGRWAAVAPRVAEENAREVGIPNDRIHVVPNGVDVDRFRPDPAARGVFRRRLGFGADVPMLALATRLEPEKGVPVALAAMAALTTSHPALRMVVAGNGADAAHLHRRACALGLADRVVFLGRLDHEALRLLHASADLFVMPSLRAEGLPMSLIEAQAAGLPAVASAVGWTSAGLADGSTGRLVPPGDPAALAAALDDLLRDGPRRLAMGTAARARAEAHFSVHAMVESFERLLSEIADAPEALRS